jgi:hypothetical protein
MMDKMPVEAACGDFSLLFISAGSKIIQIRLGSFKSTI